MWSRKGGNIWIQLVTVLILISRESVTSKKYHITMDHYVGIAGGMCLVIPCKFVADSRERFLDSKGLWLKGAEVIASTDKLTGSRKNFNAIGDPNKGDCTLKISEVTKKDAGTYYFRFEESEGSIIYIYKIGYIVQVDGYSIFMNKVVTVQKGMCVTIPCSFTADHIRSFTKGKGYWKTICKENVASTNKSVVSIKPNFQLVGNPNHGDCTLRITDATELDAGQYYFRFEDGEGKRKFDYCYKMITVQVTDLEEKPVISDPGTLTEGEEVTLTCTAPGNCPNALISWRNKTDLWTRSSSVTFTPTRNDHKASLICQMSFSSFKTSTQKGITLSIDYAPSMVITVEIPGMKNSTNRTVTVKEGDSFALRCSVDSNPTAQITWMKGQRTTISKGTSRELMLFMTNITTSRTDTYHCLAWNKYGAVNQTISINVQCKILMDLFTYVTTIMCLKINDKIAQVW
ncbi:sialic acid-binding Ig-like lectin 12 [Hyperolius riggenbachi]|uniref:sialic acid-binding Ig-like lectin 12 n=1 Tax=Hyperolius riggenbachi TaxID=752182 RepID=UPI0035A2FB03